MSDRKSSSTWVQNPVTSNGIFGLDFGDKLGYHTNAIFGYDTVGLGWTGSGGPTLDRQTIANIADPLIYVGMLGLDPRPSNFSNYDEPVPSYMSNLFSDSLIPSLTWSHTAGNRYRGQRVLGSLTLGGFGANRTVLNSVSIPFNDIDAQVLTVTVQQIGFHSKDSSLNLYGRNASFLAVIDSAVSYLDLRLSV